MIKFKNYYEILGVTPDSTNTEIKSAYRKLARKYHPDVNPNSAELFKDITEAYTTLITPEKRKQYNILNGFFETQKTNTSSQKAQQEYHQKATSTPNNKEKNYNSAFENKKNYSEKIFSDTINDIFKEFTQNEKKKKKKTEEPQNGSNITTDITITFAEALKGTTRTINVLHTHQCNKCQGRKFINGSKCSECKGKGEISEYRKITVKIPEKIKNNAKLRLKGEGNSGINGGKNGDLYLIVKVENNSNVKYEASDIYYNVPITPFEAALGGEIEINVPDGKIKLQLPSRTHSGQKFRLSGQGIKQNNKSGDIIITVHIEIPQSLSDDEIKLYEKLKKISSHNIRENL